MSEKIKSKPCLITGGCGFVGRHLTQRLLRDGREVWLVDDLSVGQHPEEWLGDGFVISDNRIDRRGGEVFEYTRESDNATVTFVHCDVRRVFEGTLADFVLQAPQFGDVFHLAAVVGGRANIDGNPLAVAMDLALDAGFYNWAVRIRPDRVLYASSSASYPIDLQTEDNHKALQEAEIQFGGRLGQPDMTYGWAKLTGEYLGRLAAEHYDLHVACIRPFSGYGEDQDTSYPIPAIAERAAGQENPLVIWGSGDHGRDFVHIDDCIEAMLRTIEKISDGSAVNIGSGRFTSFKEVAALFAKLAGYDPEIKPLVGKPVGVHHRYADPAHMRALLGWEPEISIEEGFARVLETAKARLDGTLKPTPRIEDRRRNQRATA